MPDSALSSIPSKTSFNPHPASNPSRPKSWPSLTGVACASGVSRKALYLQETLKRRDAQAGNGVENANAVNQDAVHQDAVNQDGDDGETPITHLAHSFRSLADQSRALDLLHRYETRYGREYLRALGCFNNQRDRKTAGSSKT
jgi:hypothetical protein